MDRFIWLDAEHIANLNAIAYFKIEAETLINVIFRDVGEYHQIQVLDEYAVALKRLLMKAANNPNLAASGDAPLMVVMAPEGPMPQAQPSAIIDDRDQS